jgi:hypothetical protein
MEDFLSEGGTEKAERVNPVLHRKIGHGLILAGVIEWL